MQWPSSSVWAIEGESKVGISMIFSGVARIGMSLALRRAITRRRRGWQLRAFQFSQDYFAAPRCSCAREIGGANLDHRAVRFGLRCIRLVCRLVGRFLVRRFGGGSPSKSHRRGRPMRRCRSSHQRRLRGFEWFVSPGIVLKAGSAIGRACQCHSLLSIPGVSAPVIKDHIGGTIDRINRQPLKNWSAPS